MGSGGQREPGSTPIIRWRRIGVSEASMLAAKVEYACGLQEPFRGSLVDLGMKMENQWHQILAEDRGGTTYCTCIWLGLGNYYSEGCCFNPHAQELPASW